MRGTRTSSQHTFPQMSPCVCVCVCVCVEREGDAEMNKPHGQIRLEPNLLHLCGVFSYEDWKNSVTQDFFFSP